MKPIPGIFFALLWVLALLGGVSALAAESGNKLSSIAAFEGLFDSLAKLNQETNPCVVLIDPSDPSDIALNLQRPDGLYRWRELAGRMTALSGLQCYCFHYTRLNRNSLNQPQVKAIVVRAPMPAKLLAQESGREELWTMFRETRTPTLAFCGAFHQLYLAFGGKCVDMRRLNPGEPDPNPKYFPGRLKEWGFTPIKINQRDPLFQGLGGEMVMLEQHVSECQTLPAEFEILASSANCRVQVIKHKNKPLYGTQFHPEAYDETHLDGKILLQNFFHLAGANGKLSR